MEPESVRITSEQLKDIQDVIGLLPQITPVLKALLLITVVNLLLLVRLVFGIFSLARSQTRIAEAMKK